MAKLNLTLIEREENRQGSKCEYAYVKPRDMNLPNDKKTKVIESRTKSGDYVSDDDFPNDAQERGYWIRASLSWRAQTDHVKMQGLEGKVSYAQNRSHNKTQDLHK